MSDTYTHFQMIASSEWVITHNLNRLPLIDVYFNVGGNLEKVIPAAIEHIDDTTVKVIFSQSQSGQAKIV